MIKQSCFCQTLIVDEFILISFDKRVLICIVHGCGCAVAVLVTGLEDNNIRRCFARQLCFCLQQI